MRHPDFVDAQMLIKNGYPPELAFGMKRVYRKAAAIVMGQFEGGEFDFDSMRWVEKK